MNPVAGAKATRRIGVPGAPSARLPLPRAANVNFVLFWAVALVMLIQINTFVYWTSGTVGVTRIIAVAVLLLAATARSSLVRAAGSHGILFLLTVVLHLAIGATIAMYDDRLVLSSVTIKYESLGLLVAAAAATGVHDVATRIGVERLLTGILALLTAASTSMLVLAIVLSFYFGESIFEYRSAGGHQGPNQAAFIACLTVATASAMLLWRRQQGWAVASITIAITATATTLSRTGLITLMVLAVAVVVYGYRLRGPIIAVAFSLAAVVVFGLIGWYLNVSVSNRVGRLTSLGLDTRLEAWSLGLSMIRDAPLVGHGTDAFFHMVGCYLITCGVHNQYLLLIGEAGVLPLLLWVLFFAVVFKKCSWMPNSLPKAVVGGWMVCLALYSMVAHVILTILPNFFVVGVACGLLTWDEATSDADLHRDKPLE